MDSNNSSDECSMALQQHQSPKSRRKIQAVKDAFAKFWDYTKFRSGLVAPPCSLSEVSHLLWRAAEYVVYIQQHLESEMESGDESVPLLKGTAHEFLGEMDWNPLDDPTRFVRALVHAAFQDDKGYVRDLTEEVLDEYLAEVDAHYASLPMHNWHHPSQLEGTTDCDWKATEEIASNICSKLAKLRDLPPNAEHHQRWLDISSDFERISSYLDEILGEKERINQKAAEEAPKTPATPCDARRARRKRRRERQKALKSAREETETLHPATNQVVTESESKKPFESSIPADATQPAAPIPPTTSKQPATPTQHQDSTQLPEAKEAEPEPEPNSNSSIIIHIGRVKENVEKYRENVNSIMKETALLPQNAAPSDPQELSKLIENLQHRCLESSEHLMRDLLSLDQLVVSSPEERQQRKAQVVAIQDMLDTVDQLTHKLSSLHQELAAQKAAQKAEEEAKQKQQEELEAEKAREAQKAAKVPQKEEVVEHHEENEEETEPEANKQEVAEYKPPVPQKQSLVALKERLQRLARSALNAESWKKVKMEAQFETTEQATQYVVQAYLPGVDKKALSVDLDDEETALVVSGTRVPSMPEVNKMLAQLITAIQSGKVDVEGLMRVSDEQLLLVVGSGRFGTFIQRFRLPEDVNVQSIEAQFERGVLHINLPKVQDRHAFPFPELLQSGHPPLFSAPSSMWPVPALGDLFW